ANTNGNLEIYLNVLEKTYRQFSDIDARIQGEVDRGDPEAALRLAHTFKGIAGTIGAAGLGRRFLDLEAALREKETDTIPDLLAALSAELERVTPGLEALFPEN
ncbi:MAG: Hpt domain-containing protein, partial [Chlorobiales bacterium]|nr:Hpt domain-containing protein [Chlorobiales bacterium]